MSGLFRSVALVLLGGTGGEALRPGASSSPADAAPAPFAWPEGGRGAVRLTFDDARESQVDVGIPLLDSLAFDTLLRAHVTPDGRVDYDAFARSSEFGTYLDRLATARLDALGPSDRLAFWINAYNAYTIEQVNAHRERASIRRIRTSRDGQPIEGPWSERIVRAAGRTLTLDEVEHEVIRKEFREPRIHFALVCAAVSCPPLRREAYVGARLDAQLEEQTRLFLGSRAHNRVDPGGRVVFVSPLFVWYQDDFGGSKEAVGRYLARYWPEGPEKDVLLSGRFELRETDYDWSLNAVRPASAR